MVTAIVNKSKPSEKRVLQRWPTATEDDRSMRVKGATKMSEKKFMTRRQILDTIKDLARSQGLYSRIYEAIQSLKEADPDQYDSAMSRK